MRLNPIAPTTSSRATTRKLAGRDELPRWFFVCYANRPNRPGSNGFSTSGAFPVVISSASASAVEGASESPSIP